MQNSQLRNLGLAMTGAILAAAATMFVPVSILEIITESTGLSEMVRATAAPLGDTARALIAFGTGVMVFAILAVVVSRSDQGFQQRTAMPRAAEPEYDSASYDGERLSLVDRIRAMPMPKFAFPKMPWVKGENDITELADLPKLRNGDSHPDAPARRPLVASQDLPGYEPPTAAVPASVEAPTNAEPIIANEPEPGIAEPTPAIEAPAASAEPERSYSPVGAEAMIDQVETRLGVAEIPDAGYQPTLAEMVAQLEAAVAQRQKQLDALEAVAAKLSETELAPATAPQPATAPEPEPVKAEILAPIRERRPLEAVPPAPFKDDDMDAALSAALETLHRMNATGR